MYPPNPEFLYYFGTNALWKFYQDQRGDLNIRRLVSNVKSPILLSPLTLLEFFGVLMKYYRKRFIKRKDIHAIADRLRRDTGIGASKRSFQVIPIPTGAFREAESILLQYAGELDFQTNDALHLAIVTQMRVTVTTALIFVTSDNALQRVAEKKGIDWYNPESA